MLSVPRIAVVCDLTEEKWPSMDLVADMLFTNLAVHHHREVRVTRVRPALVGRFSRLPGCGDQWLADIADRLLNRFWDHPRSVRRRRSDFDLFHIVDHSYAHIVHGLPAERTVVTCHDVDAFRCVLDPVRESRSALFGIMARRVIGGLAKAARVTCDSDATRDELLSHRVVPPERLVVVPNGVHPAYSSETDADADAQAARILGPRNADDVDVLHVGSTIPRKRIDVVLRVFREVQKTFPRARLLRVGGQFTRAQAALVDDLRLDGSIVVLPFLQASVLAAVYRRAALVLLPSEREGFGLPVVEALACGTPVVASDIPALREVGGQAVTFCPVGDVAAWRESVIGLLLERRDKPGQWRARRHAGLRRADKFSWTVYADRMVALYHEVLGGGGSGKRRFDFPDERGSKHRFHPDDR